MPDIRGIGRGSACHESPTTSAARCRHQAADGVAITFFRLEPALSSGPARAAGGRPAASLIGRVDQCVVTVVHAANPAATASSGVRNQTSASVWSYQGLSGVWKSIDAVLPLIV